MKRIRVVFLTGSLNIGGTERNILHLAAGLDPSRFDVEVWSEYEGEPLQAALRARGVVCRSLKQYHSMGRPLLSRIFAHNLPFQWRLFNLLRQRRDAVVHAFGFPMAYYTVLLGRAAGCRNVIFAVQDWDVWKKSLVYGVLDRICSRLVRRVIADGEGARRVAVARQGMEESRTITLYDGVDVEGLRPNRSAEDTRRELGLTPNRPVVGVIARLDIAKKAQDVFLNAIPRIAAKCPEAQFLLVGDGPDRALIEQRVAELPPAARPVMAGFRTDLAEMINALDILVIPSRWESVPKILLEAMWLSKPVVATCVGDIREILDDTCGLLVPPDDADALASAVASLLSDADHRRRLGDLAHERIVERDLTLDASIRAYETLYSELASQ